VFLRLVLIAIQATGLRRSDRAQRGCTLSGKPLLPRVARDADGTPNPGCGELAGGDQLVDAAGCEAQLGR